MNTNLIIKGLVICLVWLVAGISIHPVVGAEQETMTALYKDIRADFPVRVTMEEKVSTCLNLLSPETQQLVHQALEKGLSMYVIYSTAGTGGSIHFFIKVPRLRNSKGFFAAGIIIYTGLTAGTVVWKLNSTGRVVVDSRIGPHFLGFTGLGYSTFKRNLAGGAGSLVAVSFKQPQLTP